jgi:hypothetical protein
LDESVAWTKNDVLFSSSNFAAPARLTLPGVRVLAFTFGYVTGEAVLFALVSSARGRRIMRVSPSSASRDVCGVGPDAYALGRFEVDGMLALWVAGTARAWIVSGSELKDAKTVTVFTPHPIVCTHRGVCADSFGNVYRVGSDGFSLLGPAARWSRFG